MAAHEAAETVREALIHAASGYPKRSDLTDAVAALDRLVAAAERADRLEAERDELIKSLRDVICVYDSPPGPPIEVMMVMVGICRSALAAALAADDEGGTDG